MKLFAATASVLVVGVLVACGSSDSAPQDEAQNASFAGRGNLPTDKACQTDAECDNHDSCTTFSCKKESGEIAAGHCVYTLGDGKGCGAAAPDAGPTTISVPDPPDASPS